VGFFIGVNTQRIIMGAITHATQITGTNNPTKQVSKDPWNQPHNLTDIGETDVAKAWVAQGQRIGTTANGGLTISSNTITLNLGAFNSFDLGVLAAGAYKLENPSGLAANVSYKGDIKYTTPSTGAVTFSYGSGWDFDGATPSAPTANNATVFFDYASHSATNVRLTAPKAWS
jgi:hypothetical protein